MSQQSIRLEIRIREVENGYVVMHDTQEARAYEFPKYVAKTVEDLVQLVATLATRVKDNWEKQT